jgi:hypothetical protein
MALWRRYLEEFAEAEPDVEAQVVVAAYHTVEVFGALGLLLDRERHLRPLIEARNGYFRKGVERAATFDEKLMVAAYGLYNHLNTLARQFAGSGRQGLEFVEAVEKSVEAALELSAPSARASAALRAAFPLLGFMTLMLDPEKRLIEAIRKVEQRFAAGDGKAAGDWDHLLNALYRLVDAAALRDPLGRRARRPGAADRGPLPGGGPAGRRSPEAAQRVLPRLRAGAPAHHPPRRSPPVIPGGARIYEPEDGAPSGS